MHTYVFIMSQFCTDSRLVFWRSLPTSCVGQKPKYPPHTQFKPFKRLHFQLHPGIKLSIPWLLTGPKHCCCCCSSCGFICAAAPPRPKPGSVPAPGRPPSGGKAIGWVPGAVGGTAGCWVLLLSPLPKSTRVTRFKEIQFQLRSSELGRCSTCVFSCLVALHTAVMAFWKCIWCVDLHSAI